MNWKPHLASLVAIVVGVSISTLGLAGFLVPAGFIDGGVTGISMLLARVTGWPLSALLIAVNLPFVIIGYRHIGRRFAIQSLAAIVVQSVFLEVIPFPEATHDKLLAATFGGFFTGAGVGLAIRGGCVLDGTEILAVLISKRSFATVGEVVLIMNAAIFSVAALTLGIEAALYSTLTYFAGSKTIDYVLHGIEAYHGVLIVSDKHDEIRQAILSALGRGVTTLVAKGGFTEANRQVLFCVVTRLEITRLENVVKAQDAAAFFVVLQVHDASGGRVKQRAFK